MDVGDRITPQRPFAIPQSSISQAVSFLRALQPEPARGVEGRGDEGHPRDGLSLAFQIVLRQQRGLRKALGEKVEDGRHLGQRAPVDQKGGDLALRVEGEKAGRLLLPLGQ
jgi:hypothetical protein